MTIPELREKRAKAWEAAKAFLDSHRNDKGILSAEDDATYTRMEQDITDLGKEIARLEQQEALDAELSKPTAAPLTGKPLGVLADKGGAEVGVTAASATAITADELLDLFYSLFSPYRKKAVWVVNDSTIKAIRKLKDNNGQYLWQPGLIANAPDTILGRPVKTSAFMPTIAAGAKTIAFGDFSYYWVADRQGRSFKRLNELFATTGQVGFLASQRVDGKLILPEAIKVLKQKAGTSSGS